MFIKPKHSFYISVFFFTGVFANAQSINGKLTDKNKEGISYAEVVAVKDKVRKVAVTNDKGQFVLNLPDNGNYLLEVLKDGTKVYSDTVFVNGNVPKEISVDNTKEKLIEGVTVSSKKKLIDRKVDRLIFNVENSVASQGMDMMETLSITPLLNVNDNGISIVGRSGVGVMINGRVMNLSGDALVNYLRTIRSENVVSVEVITAPPAKYEAQGNGGLINIILKKNPNYGWSGMASGTYIQRNDPSAMANVVINYATEKLQASATLGYADQKKQQRDFSEYLFENSANNRIETSERDNSMRNPMLNLKLNYQISPKSDIGLITDLGSFKAVSDGFNKTNYDQSLYGVRSYNSTRNFDYNYGILNLYWDHKLDTKGKLMNVSFNYLKRNSDEDWNIVNTANTQDGVFNTSSLDHRILTGQIDFTLPFKDFKLETGTKFSNFLTKTNTAYTIFPNLNDFNAFNYDEDNYALYASLEKKWNDKLSAKAGVRYEYSDIVTASRRYTYGNFFPSAYIKYQINDDNELSASYSRRIDRPSTEQLNPFRVYQNTYSYTTGNPNLQPYYTNNIDVNYTYKGNLNIRLYSSLKEDVITNSFFENNDGSLIKSYDNLFSGSSSGVDVSYTFNIAKFWQTYASWNSYYNRISAIDNSVPDIDGWANYAYLNNTLKLNKKGTFVFSATYWHYLPRKEDNLEWRNRSNFSASFKMFFLQKTLQLNLTARDIFNQDRARFTNYITGATQNVNNYFQNRDVRLSVVYIFGNKKVRGSNKQLKLEEKNRISE